MAEIKIRVDPDFLSRIDHARGQVPRERWIRHLIERELEPVEPVMVTEGSMIRTAVSPGVTDETTGKVRVPKPFVGSPPAKNPEPVPKQGHTFQGLGKRCVRCGLSREDH